MDYGILGPLEVRTRDAAVPLRGARQRELLAVLLLHANEIVSSDRLIDDLWEGDPPPTAGKMIQNGVSQLRKLLEPDGAPDGEQLLVTRSPGYLLRVGPGSSTQIGSRPWPRKAGGSWPRASMPRRSGTCERRWPSGEARRWSTSPTRRLHGRRRPGSTSCGRRP